jgi:hypothetical protein
MKFAKTVLMLGILSAQGLVANCEDKPLPQVTTSESLDQSLAKLNSQNLRPHFETVDGRQILFVEGRPFFMLTAELPWYQSRYGQYRETMNAWDYVYPAARKMHMNTLKVAVKWSQIEPQKGVFDFSYVDHVKALAEANGLKLILGWFGHYASGASGNIYRNLDNQMFVPMDIIEDDKTYPRAVDGDGKSYHAIISYDNDAVIMREATAFRAFMRHIRETDEKTRTIIMIQVENEINVFTGETAYSNPKRWRDHSPHSDELFKAGGYSDDLKYSADRFASGWLHTVTEAGAQEYTLPFFINFPTKAEYGEPGEDAATYLKFLPKVTFISQNLYSGSAREADLMKRMGSYRIGRNIVAISETNSDRSAVAPRLAFLAVGNFAAPLFSPWAINMSTIKESEPYVLKDGTLANGAFDLQRTYASIEQAAPAIALCAGTDKLKVFLDGENNTADVAGAKVTVNFDPGGQVMVLHPAPNEFVLVGWKASVSMESPLANWPALRTLRVEAGQWKGSRWIPSADPVYYNAPHEDKAVWVHLFEDPMVVRVFTK